ncbi:hypothetical protein LIER_36501 [Lithospermum erythrorhizon]|uniref:Uncharacterized protein n=1 Tax=Lithospermum erythrorhizon TaxID=34254 RepID=A0AAV3P755_LITER
MAPGFFSSKFLENPYTLPRGQQICEWSSFKSNLQSFHVVRPLLMEGLCEGYSASDHLEVFGGMCRHLIHISSSILAEKRKLNEDYLGLHKKFEDVSAKNQKLKDKSSGFDCQITQLSAIQDASLAEIALARKEAEELQEDESKEFEAAISAAVERFKASPEFVDTLGTNAAFGAFGFVKKYKDKYPELRFDFEEFQENYKSSWFTDLDLDALSSEEENKEDALPAGDAPPSS